MKNVLQQIRLINIRGLRLPAIAAGGALAPPPDPLHPTVNVRSGREFILCIIYFYFLES